MFDRFKRTLGAYPAQFWLMFIGMFISTVGSSMVWPFLMIYVTKRLALPLTTAASLMTLNATVALVSAFIAGPIIDRVGRKWIMVVSLLGIGLVYLFYTQASSYAVTAVLMSLTGLFNPLYRVGADAMIADLIPPERRPDAYALSRMAHNLGISIGPAIGGFAAATSYNFAFLGGAAGMITYSILMAILGRETISRAFAASAAPATAIAPAATAAPATTVAPAAAAATNTTRARSVVDAATPHLPDARPRSPLAAYAQVFADRPFLYFIVAFTMNQICAALIWVLLSVHTNRNYGISESLYGFIPMTNALMVVLFQAVITRYTRQRPPLPVLAIGSLFYASAVTSIAFGRSFGAFWVSMVVMTIGELMLMPTATTYTAALAPADMRGRYMSIFSLTWGVAQGVGPVAGGFFSDNFGIAAPWLGGGVVGALAVTAFVLLAYRAEKRSARLAAGD